MTSTRTWPATVRDYAERDAENTARLMREWERLVETPPKRRYSGGMPSPGKEHR